MSHSSKPNQTSDQLVKSSGITRRVTSIARATKTTRLTVHSTSKTSHQVHELNEKILKYINQT